MNQLREFVRAGFKYGLLLIAVIDFFYGLKVGEIIYWQLGFMTVILANLLEDSWR